MSTRRNVEAFEARQARRREHPRSNHHLTVADGMYLVETGRMDPRTDAEWEDLLHSPVSAFTTVTAPCRKALAADGHTLNVDSRLGMAPGAGAQ